MAIHIYIYNGRNESIVIVCKYYSKEGTFKSLPSKEGGLEDRAFIFLPPV